MVAVRLLGSGRSERCAAARFLVVGERSELRQDVSDHKMTSIPRGGESSNELSGAARSVRDSAWLAD
jgi:hypothetical protein